MSYTNLEMEMMLKSLEPVLEQRNMVGYAAARNSRMLQDELVEYFTRKNDLIMEHGTPEVDEEGNETGQISISPISENFGKFIEEIDKYAQIEHDPQLMKIKYEDAIGILSGSEMLALEWMLED